MMKKILAMLLALVLFGCCAQAEIEYITDIVVSARPLDGSTPAPSEAPAATSESTVTVSTEPTSTPTPVFSATPKITNAPSSEPTSTPTPEPTSTPEPTNAPTPAPTPKGYEGAYEIEVDLFNQIVTVYRAGSRSAGSIARQMICSSGEDNTTPLGTFTMPELQKEDEREEWYYIGKYQLYVQYATRIVDDILFHSLPYVQKDESPTVDSVEGLGKAVSHGCIRLRPSDARWIAQNCPAGTQVHIFDDAEAEDTLRALLLKSSFSADEIGYVEFLNGGKLLSISSKLPEVEALQARLIELGYSLHETDGLFGAETHAAVVRWQLHNGYVANGELNAAQLDALLNPQPTPTPEAAPAAAQEGQNTFFTGGAQSAHVQADPALILRSAPNSQSERLDRLPNGAKVEVLEAQRGWYKVSYNGKIGYVGRDYIRFD